ncbi:MAG: hypothetical protein ACI94Y_004131, partial [Maribacter sp.]
SIGGLPFPFALKIRGQFFGTGLFLFYRFVH